KFALLPTDGGGNTEASTISSQVQRCSARQRTRRTGLVHQLVMAHFDLGLAKRPVLVERRYALNVDIPANAVCVHVRCGRLGYNQRRHQARRQHIQRYRTAVSFRRWQLSPVNTDAVQIRSQTTNTNKAAFPLIPLYGYAR